MITAEQLESALEERGSFPEVRIAEIDSSTETETTEAANTGVSFSIVITKED